MDDLHKFLPPSGYCNGPLTEAINEATPTARPNTYIFRFPTYRLPGRHNTPKEEMTERTCTPEEIVALMRHHEFPIPAITRAIPQEILEECGKTGQNPYYLPGSWNPLLPPLREHVMEDVSGSLSEEDIPVTHAPMSRTPILSLGGTFYSAAPLGIPLPHVPETEPPGLSLEWDDACKQIRSLPFREQVQAAVGHVRELAEFWPMTTKLEKGYLRTASQYVDKRICNKPNIAQCVKDSCELAHSNQVRHEYMVAHSGCQYHPVVTPRYCTEGTIFGCRKMECAFNHFVREKKFEEYRRKAK
jgi:hypothetical protein